jgi:predicted DNA-binding transcriptional regulator AlpA
MSLERLLTARELGELLGMKTAWVLDRWEAGEIPGFKIGQGRAAPVRFRASEIEAWLQTCRRGPSVATERQLRTVR